MNSSILDYSRWQNIVTICFFRLPYQWFNNRTKMKTFFELLFLYIAFWTPALLVYVVNFSFLIFIFLLSFKLLLKCLIVCCRMQYQDSIDSYGICFMLSMQYFLSYSKPCYFFLGKRCIRA